MVTIKHITEDGRERVFTVASTERLPSGELVFGTEEVIKTGKVFVMNDYGKTVAVYDFNGKK